MQERGPNDGDPALPGETAADPAPPDDGPSAAELKYGQYKFMFVLVLIALALMALSPIFNRYLEAYQAVVVAPPDVEDGEIQIINHEGMPEEKSVSRDVAAKLDVGTYLAKDEFTWNPRPIQESELSDMPTIQDPAQQPPLLLPQLYERYTSEWEGTVQKVEERRLATTGGATERRVQYLMHIETTDGKTRVMQIPDDLLDQVREGTRLVKRPRSWTPVAINR